MQFIKLFCCEEDERYRQNEVWLLGEKEKVAGVSKIYKLKLQEVNSKLLLKNSLTLSKQNNSPNRVSIFTFSLVTSREEHT